MSFSFAALGSADEVTKQLTDADISYGGQVAESIRSAVLQALGSVTPYTDSSHDTRFIVEASGHADSNTVNLTVSVRTLFVQVPDDGDEEQQTDQ